MGLVVSQLSIDSAHPKQLALWWRDVLGWTLSWDDDDEEEVGIEPPDGATTSWLFLRVPEGKAVKNRLHVDLRPPNGSDQATELDRLLSLGAVPVDVGQGPDVSWHVLADPEGNEFCLLRSTPAELAALLALEEPAAEGSAAS